jgi:hypothetical protein
MHWEPCAGCGDSTIIFDLTRTKRGYFCKKCQEKVIEEISKDPAIQAAGQAFIQKHGRPLVNNEHIQETEVPADAPREENKFFKDALQEEFGFDKPEDGSEDRFINRRPTVPWLQHRFWWLVHNAVAHPLIAVAPRRTLFRFHDYTSRKMHGIKDK